MNRGLKSLGAALTVAAAVLLFATGAHAALCSNGALMKVSGATACDAGSTNNDFINPLQVNADAIHGFDDWQYAGKQNESGTVDVGFTILGDEFSGSWSFGAGTIAAFDHVMLVMKGGAGNNTQPTYVGYLLSTDSGTYDTPFFNAFGGGAGNPKRISHWTAYVRGDGGTAVVPVPAAGLLMGTALVGFGLYGRRRRY